MSVTLGLIICFVIAVGAALQRMAGTGIGLIATPLLAIALGPTLGVLTINITGMFATLFILPQVWHDIDWKVFRRISPWLPIGTFAGTMLMMYATTSIVQIWIGALVLLSLVAVMSVPKLPRIETKLLPVATGVAGGFVSMIASVTGSVMVLYAHLAAIPHHRFVGTMQPIGFVAATLSATSKMLVLWNFSSTNIPLWLVPLIGVGILAGVRLGRSLVRVVPSDIAERLTVGVATVGAIAAIIHGIVAA